MAIPQALVFLLSSFLFVSSYGFNVTLINRDSPRSPFYNFSLSNYDRMTASFKRSIHRRKFFDSSDLVPYVYGGEYLIKATIGSPPFEILAVADTGSELIWTQCRPCSTCFKQDAQIFNPRKSTSYKAFSCNDSTCQAMRTPGCKNNVCHYNMGYNDGSYSNGDISIDTMKLGSFVPRPIVFGCGHDNGGTFSGLETGIIGLNAGEFSLLTQWKITKFAYCLVPFTSVGKDSLLIFGDQATLKGPGVVTTPLLKQTISYFVTMEAIYVGNSKLVVPFVKTANTWLDSGTTLTFIQHDLYNSLSSLVKSHIKLPYARAPWGGFNMCYLTKNLDLGFPSITLQFPGASLSLSPHNTFIMVTSDIACFGFLPTNGSNILGNRAQTNYLVSYDIRKATVSFLSHTC
ncbi:aspartic proteinase CDR1-like [Impatiens glandulifera]|uniref:aspartic proteinase CDR1-like n=1 Tax=Impatiens glandulifera TaxID=253017 RepID=UPI001FB16D19|nr:aspartic proteinase CDR1-like [Impatiens glandulifera]